MICSAPRISLCTTNWIILYSLFETAFFREQILSPVFKSIHLMLLDFLWLPATHLTPADPWPLPDATFVWLIRTSSCQQRRNVASSGTRTKTIWSTFMPRHPWVDSLPLFAGNCCCYRCEWPYFFQSFTNIIWYYYLIYLTRDHVLGLHSYYVSPRYIVKPFIYPYS